MLGVADRQQSFLLTRRGALTCSRRTRSRCRSPSTAIGSSAIGDVSDPLPPVAGRLLRWAAVVEPKPRGELLGGSKRSASIARSSERPSASGSTWASRLGGSTGGLGAPRSTACRGPLGARDRQARSLKTRWSDQCGRWRSSRDGRLVRAGGTRRAKPLLRIETSALGVGAALRQMQERGRSRSRACGRLDLVRCGRLFLGPRRARSWGERSSPSLPAPRNPQCPVAWEAVIGLATGALVQHANDVPVSERPAMADAIQSCKTTSSSVILASWRP